MMSSLQAQFSCYGVINLICRSGVTRISRKLWRLMFKYFNMHTFKISKMVRMLHLFNNYIFKQLNIYTYENDWCLGAEGWRGEKYPDPALGGRSRTAGHRAGGRHRYGPAADLRQMVETPPPAAEETHARHAGGRSG